MYKQLHRHFSMFLVSALLLSGCSMRVAVNNNEPVSYNNEEVSEDGITVSNDVIDREEILINAQGYDLYAPKTAILRVNCDDEYFEVINSDSKEAVFAGKIGKLNHIDVLNEDVMSCDFSDVTKEGNYYIHVNSIGDSKEFCIVNNLYKDILSDRLSHISEKDSVKESFDKNNFSKSILNITDRLLAEQLFNATDIKSDNNINVMPRTVMVSKAEIDVLLSYSDEKTESFVIDETKDWYELSATFSLFANFYEKYDNDYSNDLIKSSKLIFNQAEEEYAKLNSKMARDIDDERYWASAQLFKLSGSKEYRNIVESYSGNIPTGFDEDNKGYLGSLAYITSNYSTDYNISGEIVKTIMDDAIEISHNISESGYYVISDDNYGENTVKKAFANARLMVLANYISQSIDYVRCAENQLVYLYGRNPWNKDYAFGMDSDYYNESQVFILSGLLDSYIYKTREDLL